MIGCDQCSDAIAETARTADELAFWKHQAIWHRAYLFAKGKRPGDRQMREAESELEAFRRKENRERYAPEAPRDPGA